MSCARSTTIANKSLSPLLVVSCKLILVVVVVVLTCTSGAAGKSQFKNSQYADYRPTPAPAPDASDPNLKLEPYPHLLGVVASLCPTDKFKIPPDVTPMNIYSGGEGVKIELGADEMSVPAAVDELLRGDFNRSLPTVVYVHGWMQNGDALWLKKLRERYVELSKTNSKYVRRFNFIRFDWSQVSSVAYPKAVKYIPNIGSRLAKFFSTLKQRHKYGVERLHLVGYSLGAHIVGIAARQLQAAGSKVRQITALDPAGPCFYTDTAFARAYSLGQDAAETVIVRHYSFGMLGTRSASGDIDIYVNGGIKQPDTNLNKLYQLVPGGPEHLSAVTHETRIAARLNSCYSVAYKCDDYAKFNAGLCADCHRNGCHNIDLFSEDHIKKPPQSIKMFMKTGFDQICLYHYQVVAQLRPVVPINVKSAFRSGRVALGFGSDKLEAITTTETKCDGELSYTTLLTSEKELDDLKEITFTYIGTGVRLVKPKDFIVVRLNFMSHPKAHVRRSKSLTFCYNKSKQNSLELCSSSFRGQIC